MVGRVYSFILRPWYQYTRRARACLWRESFKEAIQYRSNQPTDCRSLQYLCSSYRGNVFGESFSILWDSFGLTSCFIAFGRCLDVLFVWRESIRHSDIKNWIYVLESNFRDTRRYRIKEGRAEKESVCIVNYSERRYYWDNKICGLLACETGTSWDADP